MSSTYAVLAQDRMSARTRGALLALVTALVVLILTLAEWDAGRLLSHISRAASLSVEIAIVVLLAFAFREISRRVEQAVENAFTARRREARKALIALARKVPHLKERTEVLDRIVESIDRYVTKNGCAIYLKEDEYRAAASSFVVEPPAVPADDAIVAALLAASAPVNVRVQHSRAAGTMACPMMARGELIGFLSLSASHEELEADDRQTIMALAQAAGLTLAVLSPALLENAEQLATKLAGNLPYEFASFVGREAELERVATLLGNHRIVCLKGPGGIGKSRLAVRAAANARAEHSLETWFIDLSGVTDENDILAAMASTFGITQAAGKTQIQNVTEHVADRKMLMVVDNCEHLIAAVAHVVRRLVEACPGVRVLATSQERLAVHGEAIYEVPPLGQAQAIALFQERAGEVSTAKLADHADAVEQIVSRLDGIPFAIELAAARLRVLTPEQLATRISNLFATLSGASRGARAHRQTLHAMLEWSYGLLDGPEKALFARLGVFETSFSLEAAAHVCGTNELPEDEVIGMLGNLVDKSLLLAEAGPNGQRFRLLESSREFAREVRPLDTLADERRRHAEYYLQVTTEAIDNRSRADYDLGLERLKDDVENVYGALAWALDQPNPAMAAQFGDHLAEYWFHYTQLRTGREWLAKLIGREGDMEPAQRASTHFAYACMILFSEPELALKSAATSVKIAREVGHQRLLARALNAQGNAELSLGRYPEAAASYEESAAIYDELKADAAAIMRINLANVLINFNEAELDRAQKLLDEALLVAQRSGKQALEGIILGNMARLAHAQGRYEEAYTLSHRSVETAHSLGARQQEAVWLYWLGIYATELGRHDEAATVLHEAIGICREIMTDDPEHLSGCLEALVIFAAADGRALDAARMHGFIESLRLDRGLPRPPVLQSRYDKIVGGVRTALGDQEFARHAADGSKRSAAQLLDEAASKMRTAGP